MSKYLIISISFNLLLFTFYSYWLGNALKTFFDIKQLMLSPLEVKVLQTKERSNRKPYKRLEKEKKSTNVSIKSEKSTKKRLSKKTKSKELISSLLPQVEREYEVFKKVVTTAEASYSGKKMEILSSRKLVYVPNIKLLKVSYPPSPIEVKITVLPDGRVINAVLIKKSGNPKVDKFVLNLVKNLKFEAINEPIVQEIYLNLKFFLK